MPRVADASHFIMQDEILVDAHRPNQSSRWERPIHNDIGDIPRPTSVGHRENFRAEDILSRFAYGKWNVCDVADVGPNLSAGERVQFGR